MVPGGFSKMPVQDIHVHRHDTKCEARQRSCCSHHIEVNRVKSPTPLVGGRIVMKKSSLTVPT